MQQEQSESQRPHTSAKDKVWFTYLLSALVCFRSKEAWSLNHRYRIVDIFLLFVSSWSRSG